MTRSADLATLEAAAVLLALVRAVQEAETASTADELAAMLSPVADMLEDMIELVAKRF